MKLKKSKIVAAATTLSMVLGTAAVNASVETQLANEAVEQAIVGKGLGDWVTIIAEILTFLFLVVFAIYMGRFFSVRKDKAGEVDEKVEHGVRNGMMTCLIGIALSQAAIIVARLAFIK